MFPSFENMFFFPFTNKVTTDVSAALKRTAYQYDLLHHGVVIQPQVNADKRLGIVAPNLLGSCIISIKRFGELAGF